jgi:hypothetical protein
MLVVILNVALVNFFVGSFLGPQTEMSEADIGVRFISSLDL